jgi:hypothetical protein
VAKGTRTQRPDDAAGAIQQWFDFGGGSTKNKGRATTIETTDPRDIDPEPQIVGWEGDTPILGPAKLLGKPVLTTGHTGEEGDNSLIEIPELHSPEAPEGDFSTRVHPDQPLTREQINQMLDALYHGSGAAANYTDISQPPTGPRRPLITTPPQGALPGGSLIYVPRSVLGGSRGPLITDPLPPSRPSGPLINVPLPGLGLGGALTSKSPATMSLQDLLKLRALAQLQASGTHIAAQRVA